MVTIRPEVSSCDLCLEVEHEGAWATGDSAIRKPGAAFSRLIERHGLYDVIAGLGGLIPGYVLLVPRRHVNSMGELTESELRAIFDASRQFARRVKHEFGGSCVILEHGSSGDRDLGGGACIEHAHVHVFPLDSGMSPEEFVPRGSRPVSDIAQLKSVAGKRSNYYFCTWADHGGYLSVDADLGHQYARRIWARMLGKVDEWDWAASPYLANARFTASQLRAGPLDGDVPDADIRETIRAYDCSARVYASWTTGTYPADSSLPGEIDWLARNTEGVVLDAGCGAGRDTVRFASGGRPVIALDASASLLEQVPGHRNILRKIASDIRGIPLPERTVGAVWCSAVLLHLRREKALEALRELSRVLVTGGLMEISVKEGEGHSTDTLPGARGVRRHFYFYKASDLAQLATLAGLEIVRTWVRDEADSSEVPQRWAKVLLRKSER